MKDYAESLKNAIVKNKKTSALLLLAVVGGLLILFSGAEKDKPVSAEPYYSDSDYCAETEAKIKGLVAAITGDNDCIVAVTLETGSEYIYADQKSTNTDLSKEGKDGATKESEKSEQEYIIVKSGDGSEEALIVTEKKPTIRGVAIVSGGITATNEASILNAVSSVLGISSRKISITNKS